MSDSETHFTVGASISVLSYLLHKKARNETTDLMEIFAIGLCGGAVATLPDVIDPAYSSNHRSIGHSIVLSGLLISALAKKLEENPKITKHQRDFAKSMIWSFASHLLLDSSTPAGLPL